MKLISFGGRKKKKKLEVLKVNVKSSNSHYRVTWNDRANRSRRADRQSQTGLNWPEELLVAVLVVPEDKRQRWEISERGNKFTSTAHEQLFLRTYILFFFSEYFNENSKASFVKKQFPRKSDSHQNKMELRCQISIPLERFQMNSIYTVFNSDCEKLVRAEWTLLSAPWLHLVV